MLDALKRVEKGVDKVSDRLSIAAIQAMRFQQAGNEFGKGLKTAGAHLMGMSAAVNAARSGLSGMVSEHLRLNAAASDFAKIHRETSLKLALQGGFTQAQIEKQMPAIEQAVARTPVVTLNQAVELQQQLASSGIKAEDIYSGAALDAALQLKAATASFGKDSGDVAGDIGSANKFLMATGTENPGAADLKQLTNEVASLFRDTSFQFKDLESFAANAAPLAQKGVSRTEIAALDASLANTLPPDVAASGLRSLINRVSAAGAVPDRDRALQNIGIDTADVAISKGGPKIFDVIDKLTTSFEKLDGEARNIAAQEIGGQEGSAVLALLTDRDFMAGVKRREQEARTSNFGKNAIEQFQTSELADTSRMQVKQDIALRQQTAGKRTWDDVNQMSDTVVQQQRANATGPLERVSATLGRYAAGKFFKGAEYIGLNPEDLGLETKAQSDAGRELAQDPTIAGWQRHQSKTRTGIADLERDAKEYSADGFDEGEKRSLRYGIERQRARLQYVSNPQEQAQLSQRLDKLTAALEGRLERVVAALEKAADQAVSDRQALKENTAATHENTRRAAVSAGRPQSQVTKRLERR